MFGSKKNKIEEQIKAAFAQISDQKEVFETRVTSMDAGIRQVGENVTQVVENTNDMADFAMQNIEEESALLHDIDEYSKELKLAVDSYQQLAEKLKEQNDAVINLVEENKHYTTPSKYLTEAPSMIRADYKSYEEKMDELADGGRQMSVMALNAAIEAGRMGDMGKQFVSASEEIRQTALGYEKDALAIKEELEKAQERIDELEEFVLRLVSLIKDGNVSTTRLMKKSMELNKMLDASPMRDFSEDMIAMRDKVVAMRNLDEEIGKAGERNKIQLSDIQEELENQKNDLRELESDVSYIIDEAQSKIH
ncbi:MAG: methyl-accepting chemotaxis protein [Agathobacter sp.]|nr:methyl-accepting chemotaxis protein [Agathobacter sp.]